MEEPTNSAEIDILECFRLNWFHCFLSRTSAARSLTSCGDIFLLKLSGLTALAPGGDYDYLIKAKMAQARDATILSVINDSERYIMEMGCSEKNGLDITIRAVIISKHRGDVLYKSLSQ
ncbi:hypothetical protein L2E82_15903 [Cichorium intybus]|uniref:Uncharacterized protein n=1 Tax=Cichorium intybus TaxID=13427 RepID=A0ACB9F426_CICIN|nr:hypothetical protein L2E82_15903 [Cichorium intybus]